MSRTPRPGRRVGGTDGAGGGGLGENRAGDDVGSADPALVAALRAYDRGGAAGSHDAAVLAAVAAARLIVPMAALTAEPAVGTEGRPNDTTVTMALPVMIGNDGRRALPVFTSLVALAAWDAAARPLPMSSRRAALGALAEGCAFLVVDPAGPVTWVADRAQVEALAEAGHRRSVTVTRRSAGRTAKS